MIMNSKMRIHLRIAGLVISLLVVSTALSAQSGRSWMKGIVFGVSNHPILAGLSFSKAGDIRPQKRR